MCCSGVWAAQPQHCIGTHKPLANGITHEPKLLAMRKSRKQHRVQGKTVKQMVTTLIKLHKRAGARQMAIKLANNAITGPDREFWRDADLLIDKGWTPLSYSDPRPRTRKRRSLKDRVQAKYDHLLKNYERGGAEQAAYRNLMVASSPRQVKFWKAVHDKFVHHLDTKTPLSSPDPRPGRQPSGRKAKKRRKPTVGMSPQLDALARRVNKMLADRKTAANTPAIDENGPEMAATPLIAAQRLVAQRKRRHDAVVAADLKHSAAVGKKAVRFWHAVTVILRDKRDIHGGVVSERRRHSTIVYKPVNPRLTPRRVRSKLLAIIDKTDSRHYRYELLNSVQESYIRYIANSSLFSRFHPAVLDDVQKMAALISRFSTMLLANDSDKRIKTNL